jgi:transporter family protein
MLAVLVAVVSWGVWGVMNKVAVRTVPPGAVMIITGLMSAGLGVMQIVSAGVAVRALSSVGLTFAALAGLANGVASIAFLTAIRERDASLVVGLAATYPIVTFVLAVVFLREPFSWTRAGGLTLTVLGAMLLAR